MRLFVGILWLIWMGTLAILGLSPHESLQNLALPDHHTLHLGGFLVLTLLFYFTWEFSSIKKTLMLTSLVVGPLAIVSEWIQGLLPYRDMDGLDILYNLLGWALGLILSLGLDYGRLTVYKAQLKKSMREYVRLESVE